MLWVWSFVKDYVRESEEGHTMTEEWRKINDWEIELEQRISELEASSASHTEALANGNDGLNKFFKNYKKEIAELRDAGSARQTEECKHLNFVPRGDLSYYCKDCGYDSFIKKKDLLVKEMIERGVVGEKADLIIKDSGGEKEGALLGEGRAELKDSDSTDSKPPKPKARHNSTRLLMKQEQGECVRDATRNEPRENDDCKHDFALTKTCVFCGKWGSLSPLFEVVKREDLQRWMKILPLWEKDYIKEEYNIE